MYCRSILSWESSKDEAKVESIRNEGLLSGPLTSEHRKLDELWNQTHGALEGASTERGALLETFGGELRRHIQDEENVLFAAFEARTGMTGGGPTMVMRIEHREMEALLQELGALFGSDNDTVQTVKRANAFCTLLDSHDKKEEGMLYPTMDRVFGEASSAELLARTGLGRRES